MAGSLNKAQLIGNLGKDPEVRTMNNGKKVTSFSIATSESWRDKQTGERQERTHWHNIVIFNENLGKIAEDYLKKGSKVYVEGSIQTRKWEKDGIDRYTTEIVLQAFNGTILLLDGKRDGGDRGDDRASTSSSSGGGRPTSSRATLADELDDEIPFAPEWR